MSLTRFEIVKGDEHLTSNSGLALIGALLERSGVRAACDAVPGAVPERDGYSLGQLVVAMTGLVCVGKPDFDAIEVHEGKHAKDIERFGGLTHLMSESRLPFGKGFARYFFERRGYLESHAPHGQYSPMLPFRSFELANKWEFATDTTVFGVGGSVAGYNLYDALTGD